MDITTHDALRALYKPATERALAKQITRIDAHCARFIALSPFVVISTADANGGLDASPRGGVPGFVKVVDAHTLLVPDAPGNNRLDSLSNIVDTGRIGMLFLLPGVDETLRVNGAAVLTRDPAAVAFCRDDRREPTLAIRVRVQETYLHCAKSIMRSRLWHEDTRVPRSVLPTMAEMMRDHTGMQVEPESQEAMAARYRSDL